MSDAWRSLRWGDIATLEYGKSLRGYQESIGQYPVYGTNGQIGWHSEPLCPFAGVIVGRKGAYRGIHYSDFPFFVIDTAFYLSPLQDLDTRWAYYYLLTQDINAMDSGSAIPSTSRADFYALPVLVPPLPEQRAIAHILGTLDDKIELNRRMNRTLEEMARALFQSWFVDFDPVRAKARGEAPPGLAPDLAALFPDRLVETELGEAPEGWEVKTLGNVAEVVKGRSYRSSDLQDSDTALVTLKSFQRGGGYRPDGLKAYTGTYLSNQVIKPGELIVAYTDVTQQADVIGKPALVRNDQAFRTLVASLDVGIVRPKRPEVSRYYLYSLLLTDGFQNHTYAHSNGSTVLHLGKNAVQSFEFLLPPHRILDTFHDVVWPMYQRIDANEAENSNLESLRNTILPKLMSGEVRVPEAAEMAGA